MVWIMLVMGLIIFVVLLISYVIYMWLERSDAKEKARRILKKRTIYDEKEFNRIIGRLGDWDADMESKHLSQKLLKLRDAIDSEKDRTGSSQGGQARPGQKGG